MISATTNYWKGQPFFVMMTSTMTQVAHRTEHIDQIERALK